MPRGTTGPTITQVAEEAGVSRATVSRVLNGRTTVNPEIGSRVRAAADRLHYRPNFTARNLSTGRTHTIALLVPELGNPLFQAILRNLSAAAERTGYRVLVAEAPDPDNEAAIARDARDRCDAVVLCAPRMEDVVLDSLVTELDPVVLVNRQSSVPSVSTVSVDYAAGIRMIADHLLNLGHRDLMFVCGPPRSQANSDRLDALRAFQAVHPTLRIRSMLGGATMADGYRVADDALSSGATAVMGFNDLVAFGILARLNEIGVAVPADISVTGFDGIELSGFAVPSLTTARQDEQELGRRIWALLHARLDPVTASDGAVTTEDERLVLQPTFVARDSTGRVPPLRIPAPAAAAADASSAPAAGEDLGEGGTSHALAWSRDLQTAAQQHGGDVDDLDAREGWVLRHDGRVLADLRTGYAMTAIHSPRPHLHPVVSLAGRAMTGVNPVDHRHHYGVSMAVPDVNGSSFWGGRTFVEGKGPTLLANHGRQELDRVVRQNDPRSLGESIRWIAHDGSDLAREERRLGAFLLPDADGWGLDWDSALHADSVPLRIGSPAIHGRPGAGYGGFFWRLPDGDDVDVEVREGHGEDLAHGSSSPFLIVERRHGREWSSLVLIQDVEAQRRVDPWFVRSTDYVGVGASLAWDEQLDVPLGGSLPIRVTAAVLDRRASPEDVPMIIQARDTAAAALAAAEAGGPAGTRPDSGGDADSDVSAEAAGPDDEMERTTA